MMDTSMTRSMDTDFSLFPKGQELVIGLWTVPDCLQASTYNASKTERQFSQTISVSPGIIQK